MKETEREATGRYGQTSAQSVFVLTGESDASSVSDPRVMVPVSLVAKQVPAWGARSQRSNSEPALNAGGLPAGNIVSAVCRTHPLASRVDLTGEQIAVLTEEAAKAIGASGKVSADLTSKALAEDRVLSEYEKSRLFGVQAAKELAYEQIKSIEVGDCFCLPANSSVHTFMELAKQIQDYQLIRMSPRTFGVPVVVVRRVPGSKYARARSRYVDHLKSKMSR